MNRSCTIRILSLLMAILLPLQPMTLPAAAHRVETPGGTSLGVSVPLGQSGYSAQALETLLYTLANRFDEDYSPMLRWLFTAEIFGEEAFQEMYTGLTETPERAESLFSATDALFREYGVLGASSNRVEHPAQLAKIQRTAETLELDSQRLESSAPQRGFVAAEHSGRQLDDPYLAEIVQEAVPTKDSGGEDRFRHYTLATGFTLRPGEAAYGDTDIVLVVDSSLSMANRLYAMKAAAVNFVSQPEICRPGNRIAVVTYSDSAQPVLELCSASSENGGPNPEILQAIADIRTENMSNLQAGIVAAGQMLDLYEGESAHRKQAVILLTDGTSNYRYTDIWRLSLQWEGLNALWQYDIDLSAEPQEGAKRWSHALGYSFGEQIYLDAELVKTGIVFKNDPHFAATAARLEAQYLVAQGAELYAIDYSGGVGQSAVLEALTHQLTNAVHFTGGKSDPPYEGTALSQRHYEDETRIFSAADGDFIQQLALCVAGNTSKETPSFVLRTVLTQGFEFLDDPQLHITDETGALIAGNMEAPQIVDDTLTWTTPEGLGAGSYFIRCDVRVKEDPGQPMRWYPDGGEYSPSTADIAYQGTRYSFDPSAVTVPPLLWANTEDVAVFAGEQICLTGQITRGNGSYRYRWLDEEASVIQEGTVPLTGFPGESAGLNLSVPIPPLSTVQHNEGRSVYLLEITDIQAFEAGYSGGRLRLRSTVTAVGGSLTVRIVAEDGQDLSGSFETAIVLSREGQGDERCHFSGLEQRYTPTTGLQQGRYESITYVPYGYRVTNTPQAVDMAPLPDGIGGWVSCHKTVTISIEKTRPRFFFGWAWQ